MHFLDYDDCHVLMQGSKSMDWKEMNHGKCEIFNLDVDGRNKARFDGGNCVWKSSYTDGLNNLWILSGFGRKQWNGHFFSLMFCQQLTLSEGDLERWNQTCSYRETWVRIQKLTNFGTTSVSLPSTRIPTQRQNLRVFFQKIGLT